MSVLASIAPSASGQLSAEDLQSVIQYEKVASILRSSNEPQSKEHKYLSGSSTNTSPYSRHESVEELKKTRPCSACGQLGHNSSVMQKGKFQIKRKVRKREVWGPFGVARSIWGCKVQLCPTMHKAI